MVEAPESVRLALIQEHDILDLDILKKTKKKTTHTPNP